MSERSSPLGHRGRWQHSSPQGSPTWSCRDQVAGCAAAARELFQQLCGFAGRTGLLPEQVDPRSGRALGNHPQAYSHLGLINNALHLDDGEGER